MQKNLIKYSFPLSQDWNIPVKTDGKMCKHILVQPQNHFPSRHLRALGLCWSLQLHHSTASSFSEGQQHLLAHRLINWLIRRPQCKLIDWLSWDWTCLYLEPQGAKLWRSPLICHVQHTGEDEGAMKSCGFITKTQGACLEEVSAKMGACRANNGNMGTKGMRMKGTEKVVRCWQRKNEGWMTDMHKGKKRKCLVCTMPCWFIHMYIKLGWKRTKLSWYLFGAH